jgi:hypothetical protein
MWRWVALGAYAAFLYGLLPYGPTIGGAAQQSAIGQWVLGRGAAWLAAAGVVVLLVRLRRRVAPPVAYAIAAAVALGFAFALTWLRAVRLERVHIPEYGLAALLAWQALVPTLGDRRRTYVAAAAVAALLGWGDELLQAVTPGRYYDLRDVASNALGATLGTLTLAVWRSGKPPPDKGGS